MDAVEPEKDVVQFTCSPVSIPFALASCAARSESSMNTIALAAETAPSLQHSRIRSVVTASRPQSSALMITNPRVFSLLTAVDRGYWSAPAGSPALGVSENSNAFFGNPISLFPMALNALMTSPPQEFCLSGWSPGVCSTRLCLCRNLRSCPRNHSPTHSSA